jgi:hypothetical protein
MSDRVEKRLTLLPDALRADGWVPLPYRVMRERALDGVFSAHQKNFFWHFYRDDVPTIAKALCLERATSHKPAAASTSQRAA